MIKKRLKLIGLYFKSWNIWRKHNRNSNLYKILVLCGVQRSATFTFLLLEPLINEGFIEGAKNGQ